MKRRTIVAHVTTANEIPPTLTPKIIVKASTINVHPSAQLGAGVGIERKSANLDAP